MMSPFELADHFTALNLDPLEAAQLLGVTDRTIRRWAAGEPVSIPAEQALRAWRRLHELHLPWKPDAISALVDDSEQLRKVRDHTYLLDELMREVEARGGPRNPWTVDLAKQQATFGPMEVGFYVLAQGGVSPSSFRRLDRPPSPDDTPDIQEAVYCIALAFARARAGREALLALAVYTRKHAHVLVFSGPALPSPEEKARRQALVALQADRLEALAVSGLDGAATYKQVEQSLAEMRRAGFYPQVALISAVAQNLLGRPGAAFKASGA